MKFIYVFTKEDKNILLSRGLSLLKEDNNKNIFVFANDDDEEKKNIVFSELGDHVFSNTLTF